MDELKLLVDLHKATDRQGPGGTAEAELALHLSGLKNKDNLKIADIGCGTGASPLFLAQQLNAHITAVDLFEPFLDILRHKSKKARLQDKIHPLCCSMDDLPFEKESLDAIWSEGAMYNMGYKNAVQYWQDFIKPKGILAVSEITWITKERPHQLETYWKQEYPEIDTASNKIAILEDNGFKLMGYFPLPISCWMDNYYIPLEAHFDPFLTEYNNDKQAQQIVQATKDEISLYKSYKDYYSYGFYVAQKS